MSEKLVFAHLLTWFQTKEYSKKWEMWNSDYEGSIHNPDVILENGKRDIASLTYPLIGVYDSNDEDVIEYQLLTMKLAGIDGVIIDWDGREINHYRHVGLLNVLPKLRELKMKLMICFEEWCGYWPISNHQTRKEQIDKAITELKWLSDNILSTDEYYQQNNRHPILVFRKIHTHWFNSEEWQYIKEQTKKYQIDFYFNDVYDTSFHPVSDGYFTWVSGFNEDTNLNDLNHYDNQINSYINTLEKLPNKKFIGSVMPGFNDQPVNGWGGGTRIAPRYDMKRYLAAWDYMNKMDVDLVQIVTWNDWNEGSQIEPCDEYGYQYITETKKQITKFKGKDSIEHDSVELPLWLFKERKHENSNKIDLDTVSMLLSENKIKEAKLLIEQIKESKNV